MPSFSSRDDIPGWEPGAPKKAESGPVRWNALVRMRISGGIDWAIDFPAPAPNASNLNQPLVAPAGAVGVKSGVVFGVFSGDGGSPFSPDFKFLWFYRYDDKGNQVEVIELAGQNYLRTYTGNDLIIDKEGRLWWMAYPTRASEEGSNLAQVWRMPIPAP